MPASAREAGHPMKPDIINLISGVDRDEDSARSVKSALRAMQVLDILHSTRTGLRLRDIASLMNAPTSSVDYILKTMVLTGHLLYNPHDRIYELSHRIGLIGNWLSPLLISNGPLIDAMREICEVTGHNVSLAARNGDQAECIHVESGSISVCYAVVGRHRPLPDCASGLCLMSLLPDAEIAIIVRRYNAGLADDHPPLRVSEVMARIGEIRSRGHMFRVDAEGWAFATPLPGIVEPALAMTSGALTADQDVDIQRLHAVHMDMLTRHLGAARSPIVR